jgi:hypothetical protein
VKARAVCLRPAVRKSVGEIDWREKNFNAKTNRGGALRDGLQNPSARISFPRRRAANGGASSQTEDEKPRVTRRRGALGKQKKKRHSGCGGVNRETKQITIGTLAPHSENQLGRASARVRRRPKHKQAREEFLQEEKSSQQLRPTI